MQTARIWFVAALLALAAWSCAVPSILIVQVKPEKNATAMASSICDYLANEIQQGGKLEPIAWGITDPVYRAAVDSGKIPRGDDHPPLGEALKIGGRLKAEYVLAVSILSGEGEALSAAALYKSGRLIWKDPDLDLGPALAHLAQRLKKKEISQEEYEKSVLRARYRVSAIQISSRFGPEDTMRSIARTWSEMMNGGPLASLPKKPESATPDPANGQAPTNPGTGTPPKVGDDSKWTGEYTAALKVGDSSRAMAILRDAIDASPLDSARRMALIKTLKNFGQPEVAAKEARRAAELLPENLEFRAMAARCWIQCGNHDEAQADLNEAVTRAPDSAETRQLLGEVAIAKGDFKTAIDHLDKAIAAKASGDTYYFRSLAHAMAGNTALAAEDSRKALEAGLSADPENTRERYSLVAAMFDDGIAHLGGEIRTLHQRALVQRGDREVRSSYDELRKQVEGRAQYISSLPAPSNHETSHNRRVLAYKLLSQCLTDLESYLKTGNEDVLTESRINLGEALKQAASARQRFKDEQQGTKKSDAKSG